MPCLERAKTSKKGAWDGVEKRVTWATLLGEGKKRAILPTPKSPACVCFTHYASHLMNSCLLAAAMAPASSLASSSPSVSPDIDLKSNQAVRGALLTNQKTAPVRTVPPEGGRGITVGSMAGHWCHRGALCLRREHGSAQVYDSGGRRAVAVVPRRRSCQDDAGDVEEDGDEECDEEEEEGSGSDVAGVGIGGAARCARHHPATAPRALVVDKVVLV